MKWTRVKSFNPNSPSTWNWDSDIKNVRVVTAFGDTAVIYLELFDQFNRIKLTKIDWAGIRHKYDAGLPIMDAETEVSILKSASACFNELKWAFKEIEDNNG